MRAKGAKVLAAIAAALLAVVAAGQMLFGPGYELLALCGWLATVLLLELPAVAWRMRGANWVAVWLGAMVGPLVPLEILLAVRGYRQRDAGGDLQGFEWWLMVYVVPSVVLVTASAVAALACRVIRPEPRRN